MSEALSSDLETSSVNRGLLQLIVVLQVAILIGMAMLFINFGGLADEVANRVPTSDDSGQIFELQGSIDSLSTKVDAIQAAVGASPAP